MKLITIKSVRLTGLLFLITTAVTLTVHAQDVRSQLNNLDKLEAKASDSVDVTLDGKLLQLAIVFLDPKKPEEAAIRDVVSGLKGIYVKSFKFDKEGDRKSVV